ncbi:MAG: ROK family transcriptional regulator [Rhodospirillales bacterium]|nr:ROK family transcriptional regulator [Rhodospirillales bacterium]
MDLTGDIATAAPTPPTPPHIAELGRGTSQSGVRLYNERLILSLIRRHAALPKAEIARLTGLSAQATTVIVQRLEADGLLRRLPPRRGRVGQPSVPFALAPGGAFALGLKIGRKSSDLVLLDFTARVRHAASQPHAYPEPRAVCTFVATRAEAMLAGMRPRERARIAGLGIAIPFELWNWEREVGAPRAVMDQWREFDIRRELGAMVPIPVYLCNDATSACAAELFFGEGFRYRDFLHIFIGSFVGGGLVLDGNLFLGRTGNAGAIGSVPVTSRLPGGRPHRQQLIRSASIHVLEKALTAAGRDASPLWRTPDDWGGLGAILDDWIARAADDLAQAIVAANAVVDFEAAIIDGALPRTVLARIVERTAAAIQRLDLQGLAPVAILPGTIGPQARAIGAAALPFLAHFARDREVLFKQLSGAPTL